ncbi:ankyrin repeats (3 copies) domain-containing protein [Ditylenchus destructor]|uniref:Ankyrin repeats (3 copies) domain-containing protein n=1 Tax=Ditylenchus destructor TaxID=166010 RepID=A0AAD4N457_9BILA|nr:ankyrin repeats (3 copies) domain-containing protein [Ditylenchus destructor]
MIDDVLWPYSMKTSRMQNWALSSAHANKPPPRYFNPAAKYRGGWDDFECRHTTLFSTILAMDKANGVLTDLQNSGLPLNKLDSHEQTVWHWAVKRGSWNCLHELLLLFKGGKASRWIMGKDRHGVTPLHLAAKQPTAKFLKALLCELGPRDLYNECRDFNGQSPLHYAAAAGSLATCEVLLEDQWKLPLDQRDVFGQTPLMYAVGNKKADAETIRLLGGKKSITVAMRNKRGMTALHIAVLANNATALDVLLNQLKFNATVFDNENRTPLHYAALYGRMEMAQLLIHVGASNDTRDCHNVTAAHYAAQAGHFETLSCILQASGGKDLLDSDNRSCLMWAVIAGRAEVVKKMLTDKNVELFSKSHKDNNQHTALHLAALNGNKEICKILVEDGYNTLERDIYDATPDHLAAGQGHIDAVTYFTFNKGGSGPALLDTLGRTPFFYACLGGQAHVVDVMARGQPGLDANHEDSLGQTAMHCAVIAGSVACVDVLLKHGYEPNAADHNGTTPLELAKEKDMNEIVRLLAERINPVKAIADSSIKKNT